MACDNHTPIKFRREVFIYNTMNILAWTTAYVTGTALIIGVFFVQEIRREVKNHTSLGVRDYIKTKVKRQYRKWKIK